MGMTLREHQKAATRKRVLAVARDLFETKGYQATTMREIAKAADVSLGTPLAHFGSKSGLLRELIWTKRSMAGQRIEAATAMPAPVADRLLRMLRIMYEVDWDYLRLVSAMIAETWLWDAEAEADSRAHFGPISGPLQRILSDAQAGGEIARSTDLDRLGGIILSTHQAIYRRIYFDGWTIDQAEAEMQASLALILNGVRPS